MLQIELTNIEDMYNSCKTTIISAINLLHTNPSFNRQSQSHICHRRHSINILMDKVDATSHDINNLYNLTTSLATSVSFHQLIFHLRSVFANLCNSLNHIQMVSTHTMDYINAATSGILSPHILPAVDLQKTLLQISDTLPPTLHLPVSPGDTPHFYRYLCTHILIAKKQFLLLINVPIQDRS